MSSPITAWWPGVRSGHKRQLDGDDRRWTKVPHDILLKTPLPFIVEPFFEFAWKYNHAFVVVKE